ncbi:DUF397 domain-containing protein [Micromonospora craniellae]|uniref:DUF397 domain-containing protein n=1 Tax=Micromonospora craniellae TaxID=2294034 RepID=A0A372G2L3_9ACTN|nr:DUF397 domain-containing protein [Micromonospora craniellae]QOC91181.1 DUF397 domain-containing protein [Micromonospora craniellae]RFS47305.1 DUF397 domain-containing protein [Micromonospora craniellae]
MTTDDLKWRKSSRSSASGSDCIEVAEVGGGLAVRDSRDPVGPVLRFERAAWSAFVTTLRD